MSYTLNNLNEDILEINHLLEGCGVNIHILGQHKGYTAIYLATRLQTNTYMFKQTLTCGTPLECIEAARQYLQERT